MGQAQLGGEAAWAGLEGSERTRCSGMAQVARDEVAEAGDEVARNSHMAALRELERRLGWIGWISARGRKVAVVGSMWNSRRIWWWLVEMDRWDGWDGEVGRWWLDRAGGGPEGDLECGGG
ncbi:hypothetical protein TRIUR3_12585 [Triticum urartu]|uniref:Uncharacterized protein n=1 Tax=Triticum urartu TaxID=4572 RepID=M7Z008_TRIUA|nr:hypothetical protein TRIUR3_12585 [Triticum urartu]